MDVENITTVLCEFPATVKAVSVFKDNMHYIFLNSLLSDELKEIALNEEKARTYTA